MSAGEPVRIRIAPADPELQELADRPAYQPSFLPGSYPVPVGEPQRTLPGLEGCESSRRRTVRPRHDQPPLPFTE